MGGTYSINDTFLCVQVHREAKKLINVPNKFFFIQLPKPFVLKFNFILYVV